MSGFFETIQMLTQCATVFAVVFVILIAMPQSKLRSICVELMKYVFAGLCCLLIMSPIDIVPDFLVGPGQIDDLGYIVAAILAVRSGINDHQQRRLGRY